MAWFVYLVRCRDNSLYCGITKDVAARVAVHNAGKGAKYTRSRGPVTLAWSKRVSGESAARKQEYATKCLSKAAKEQLVPAGTKSPRRRGRGEGERAALAR
jgi:putative endonuclease